MDYFRAVILGIVQGLAEFLPISSSGHLILVPALFNWPDQGLAFDIGLHMGTLMALLAYFWRDWWRMGYWALRDFGAHRLRFQQHGPDSRLLWLIVVGSVPTAIVGLLFDDWIERELREPWLVAIALAVVGLVMMLADRHTQRSRTERDLTLRDVILIGLAQSAALFPGVSRSGATMSMGMFRHLTRDGAARFAFLLGTPAFIGAFLLKAKDLTSVSGEEALELGIGFMTSALVGVLVIHYLMRFLRTRTLMPFVYYRFGVAALTLIIGGIRVA